MMQKLNAWVFLNWCQMCVKIFWKRAVLSHHPHHDISHIRSTFQTEKYRSKTWDVCSAPWVFSEVRTGAKHTQLGDYGNWSSLSEHNTKFAQEILNCLSIKTRISCCFCVCQTNMDKRGRSRRMLHKVSFWLSSIPEHTRKQIRVFNLELDRFCQLSCKTGRFLLFATSTSARNSRDSWRIGGNLDAASAAWNQTVATQVKLQRMNLETLAIPCIHKHNLVFMVNTDVRFAPAKWALQIVDLKERMESEQAQSQNHLSNAYSFPKQKVFFFANHITVERI